MPSTDDLLPPARDVNADAVADAFLASSDASLFENTHDLVRTLAARAIDALAPVIRAMARQARHGMLPDADGVRVSPVEFPSPWRVGFVLDRPGEAGMLYVASLRIPLDRSPSFQAAAATRRDAHRRDLEAQGVEGVDLRRRVVSRSIMDEIEIEEEMLRGGAPDDLPHPDGFDDVEEVRIVRFAAEVPAGSESKGIGAFYASARPCVGTGLAKTIEAVSADAYLSDTVLSGRPSTRSDAGDGVESWGMRSGSDTVDPTLWIEAFSRLASVAPGGGHLPAIAKAAAEVGTRAYVTYSEPGDDRALDMIGASLALRDGGIPGPEAGAWIRAFEARLLTRRFSGIADDLGALQSGLVGLGYGSPEAALDFQDLNNGIWATDGSDGPDVVTLTCQHGQYAFLLSRDGDGYVSGVSMARYGRPLEDYLDDDADPRDIARMEYGELHRDYANPEDPAAHLGWDGAVGALRAGRTDFPGFLARFEVTDGTPACIAIGPYTTRTVRDLGNLASLIPGGLVALRDELETRASPPMR